MCIHPSFSKSSPFAGYIADGALLLKVLFAQHLSHTYFCQKTPGSAFEIVETPQGSCAYSAAELNPQPYLGFYYYIEFWEGTGLEKMIRSLTRLRLAV